MNTNNNNQDHYIGEKITIAGDRGIGYLYVYVESELREVPNWDQYSETPQYYREFTLEEDDSIILAVRNEYGGYEIDCELPQELYEIYSCDYKGTVQRLDVDLFEHIELLGAGIQNAFNDVDELNIYQELERVQNLILPYGYTFEFGLSGEPHSLKKCNLDKITEI